MRLTENGTGAMQKLEYSRLIGFRGHDITIDSLFRATKTATDTKRYTGRKAYRTIVETPSKKK